MDHTIEQIQRAKADAHYPKLEIRAEVSQNDPRSDTASCLLTLTNHGSQVIALFDILVEQAEGVVQTLYFNSDTEKEKREYEEARNNLAKILGARIILSQQRELDDFSEALLQVIAKKAHIQSKIPFLSLSQKTTDSIVNDLIGALTAKVRIHRSVDADALLKLVADDSDKPLTNHILQISLTRMKSLEEKIDKPITQIFPGQSFRRAFTFSFKRDSLHMRQYSLHFVCRYLRNGIEEAERATEVISIAPHPIPLSLTAACAALGASVIKIFIEINKDDSSKFEDLFFDFRYTTAAVLLSLIFYNIYDFTEFGSKLNNRVGWRSAVLIGALCGLLTDRLVAAINAFFGQ